MFERYHRSVLGTGIIRNWFAQHRARGAAVPFEAPALRMARVCDDERDGLIAILRDFANNGTAYIVPWTSLPLMAPMTDHDMALHQAVEENRASTPAQVRAVVSKLALSGALGPEARARESERSRIERNQVADVELLLILHLLDDSGADLAALAAKPGGWSNSAAKAAVTRAAKAVGVKRQDIYRRIGEFARLLAPVGLPAHDGEAQSGWLRVLHTEIEAFGESTAVDARSRPPEIAPYLAATAETAMCTAQLAGVVLGMLDFAMLDVGATIRRWDTELPVLRQAIERLSSMLDEWPALMKLAHDALRAPAEEATAQLRILRSMLPRVPAAEQQHDGHASDDVRAVAERLCARLSAIRSMLGASRAVAPA